ncbi:MAG: transporter substrate-binding domain-containing protein [Phormidesmis sp.]
MKRFIRSVCGFALAVLFVATVGSVTTPAQPAQTAIAPATADDETRFKVGTKEIFPFVFLDEEVPYGYSVDLWDKVASDLDIQTEWVRYDSVADLLSALSSRQIDAAIAGISITAEREAQGFDFSYPFYRSGLQIMVRKVTNGPLRIAINGLLSWNVWRPLLLVMATSTAVGISIWLLERRHNDSFSENPIHGIGQGMWFAIVTLGTFGYGDITPIRLPGRLVAVLWMGVSFFVLADFIASLTVVQLAQRDLSFQDLAGETVGVINSTTGEDYVRTQPVSLIEFDTFEGAIAALETGRIRALVHDYPTLRYVASNSPAKFELVGKKLTQEDYGIAFSEAQAETIEAFNQEILSLQEQGYLRMIGRKWFGEEENE